MRCLIVVLALSLLMCSISAFAADAARPAAPAAAPALYKREPTEGGPTVAELEDAIAAGNRSAYASLGSKYVDGEGVEVDERRAFELFTRGAELGSIDCMFNLGLFYEKGLGGYLPDNKSAARWYKKAAEKGSASGSFSYAYALLSGEGLKRDGSSSLKWFIKSGELGNANGWCGAAVIYANGLGVKKNLAKAKQFAQKGYAAGAEYCKELHELHNLANY